MTRTRVWSLLISFAFLTACGGGGHAGSALMPSDSVRHVMDTSNPNDTLYVEYATGVNDFPLTASGAATPSNSFQAHPNQNPTNDGIATSTSGSAEILQDYLDASSSNDCRVVEEPGNATGNTTKTNQLDCEGLSMAAPLYGRAIAANYNNELDFLFASSAGAQELGRLTFPTAGAPQALTTFSAGSNHINAVGAAQGHIFATSATGNGTIITGGNPSTTTCSASASGSAQIDNYAQGATTIKKSFTIANRTAAGAIAVSQDDSQIYVATCIAGSAYLAIDQIAGAAGTPGTLASVAPTSSIGPFNAQYITALTVDGQGDLYVGLQDSNGDGGTTVRVYAPSAFVPGTALTKPTPMRVLNNPIPTVSGKITGLAVNQTFAGAATPTPSPSPTVAPTATPTVAPTATPTLAPTPTASPTPLADACSQSQVNADASPLISTTTTPAVLQKVASAKNVCFSAYVFTTVAYNALITAANNKANVHVIYSSQEATSTTSKMYIANLIAAGATVTVVTATGTGVNSSYPIHAKMAIVDGSVFLDGHNWVEQNGSVPDDVVIADNSSADFASVKAALNISNPSNVPDSARTASIFSSTNGGGMINVPAFTVLKDHSLSVEGQFLQNAVNNGQVGPGTTVDYMTESFSSGAATVVNALEAAGQAGAAVNVIVVYSDESDSTSDINLLHTMTQPPYNIKVYSNTSTGSEKVMSIQGTPGIPNMVWYGSSNSTSTSPTDEDDFIDWGMLVTDPTAISNINAYYAQQLAVAVQKNP